MAGKVHPVSVAVTPSELREIQRLHELGMKYWVRRNLFSLCNINRFQFGSLSSGRFLKARKRILFVFVLIPSFLSISFSSVIVLCGHIVLLNYI